jgi:putative transcriptional regulator
MQHIGCMDQEQSEFLFQLGQRIKKIRKEKGLSQSEVANKCGKERQSYQRVETGNINPTIWYLQHIATALDMDMKMLLDCELIKPKL